ncbi:hypothetical protein ACS0TY_015514 [Phlomoides rotata]
MRSSWINGSGMGRTLIQLGLGQLVSLDLAIIGFTSSSIAIQVDAPLATSFSTYLALTLVYGTILLYRRKKLLVSWYWYVLLGFIDVHGNYLVNKAFQFTSITSVAILDCFTIAWAILLTWILLGTKYSGRQFFGAAICVGGLGLVLLSDAGVGGGGGSNPLLGDFLVIAGSFCFAMSNVGEEFCVKRKDLIEVIAMIGVFGMLVSACEIVVLEKKTLESVKWSTELLLTYAGYEVSSFLFYTLVPYVLKMSGSTLFNLSLLTSDMWAVVIRIFIYKQKVDGLYYLAFFLVVVGLIIYSKTEESPDNTTTIHENSSLTTPDYCLIEEENFSPEN